VKAEEENVTRNKVAGFGKMGRYFGSP